MRGGARGDDTRLHTGTERPTSVTRVAALPMKDLRTVEGHDPRAYGSGGTIRVHEDLAGEAGTYLTVARVPAALPGWLPNRTGGVTREAWTRAHGKARGHPVRGGSSPPTPTDPTGIDNPGSGSSPIPGAPTLPCGRVCPQGASCLRRAGR
jgi:hypothetical protein